MMIKHFLIATILSLFSGIAGAIPTNSVSIKSGNEDYISVKVDKEGIRKDSVLRLQLDVQFDLGKNSLNNKILESLSGTSNSETEPELQEASGYRITIKLPIAEHWRRDGERLRIKISADTDVVDEPAIGMNEEENASNRQ